MLTALLGDHRRIYQFAGHQSLLDISLNRGDVSRLDLETAVTLARVPNANRETFVALPIRYRTRLDPPRTSLTFFTCHFASYPT